MWSCLPQLYCSRISQHNCQTIPRRIQNFFQNVIPFLMSFCVYEAFLYETVPKLWIFTQHCGYWCPGALVLTRVVSNANELKHTTHIYTIYVRYFLHLQGWCCKFEVIVPETPETHNRAKPCTYLVPGSSDPDGQGQGIGGQGRDSTGQASGVPAG